MQYQSATQFKIRASYIWWPICGTRAICGSPGPSHGLYRKAVVTVGHSDTQLKKRHMKLVEWRWWRPHCTTACLLQKTSVYSIGSGNWYSTNGSRISNEIITWDFDKIWGWMFCNTRYLWISDDEWNSIKKSAITIYITMECGHNAGRPTQCIDAAMYCA